MKWEIIKKFSAENKSCFSYKDVIAEYPDKDHSYLSKVLAVMVRLGMLMKLSRDVYHIFPLSADPQTYLAANCIRCAPKRCAYQSLESG